MSGDMQEIQSKLREEWIGHISLKFLKFCVAPQITMTQLKNMQFFRNTAKSVIVLTSPIKVSQRRLLFKVNNIISAYFL